MADFYKTNYGSSAGRRRNQGTAIGLLVDIIFSVVSLIVAVLFIMVLFVPRLDPREWGDVSTLGLIAPFIYAAQTALTLYWIMRWRKVLAVIMLFISLFGLFNLSLFYRVETRRVYNEAKLRPTYDSKALKVLTYNVRSFIDEDGERCIDSIVSVVKALNPDIVCFQEMGIIF